MPRVSSPAVAEPLAAHCVFDTTDAAVAEGHISRLYAPHRQRVMAKGRFDAHMNAAELGGLLISYLSYGAAMLVECPGLQDQYVINVPLGRSTVVVHQHRQRFTTHAGLGCVFHCEGPIWTQWTPEPHLGDSQAGRFRLISARVKRRHLEQHLGRMLGH